MRVLVLAWLVGCGGGSDSPVDADNSAQCLIPGSYGNLGTKTGTPMNGFPSSLSVVLDAGPPRDNFFINLKMMGVFAGGLQTGTFTIQGAETSQATCGLCVNIVADIVMGQGPSKFYFATSGSVTLTATTPPAGTLSNVMFQEVTAAGSPISGGCTGAISSLSFGP